MFVPLSLLLFLYNSHFIHIYIYGICSMMSHSSLRFSLFFFIFLFLFFILETLYWWKEGLRVRLGPAFRLCRRGAAPVQVGAQRAAWVEPYPREPASPVSRRALRGTLFATFEFPASNSWAPFTLVVVVGAPLGICIETDENENTTTQNLWDTVKAVLRHGLQRTRLLHPWDFPGKSGVPLFSQKGDIFIHNY